jgi:hypothetical protein
VTIHGRFRQAALPFDYYESLTRKQKADYDKSDRVSGLRLRKPGTLAGIAKEVEKALGTEKTAVVQTTTTRLCDAIARDLEMAPVRVKVLAKRPKRSGEELHGLYEREDGQVPLITVWMRTAEKKQVVTFRTFLRTLLHEVCHHVDYELLHLKDTFHTQGFFKRESSLVRAILPEREKKLPRKKERKLREKPVKKPVERPAGPVQLELFPGLAPGRRG